MTRRVEEVDPSKRTTTIPRSIDTRSSRSVWVTAALAMVALSCSSEPLALDRDMEVTPASMTEDTTRVSVSITALASGNAGEKEKEIYAVALYTDGSEDRTPTECQDRQGLLLNCGAFTMVASPVYKNITVGSPVSLSGSGIILYPNRAPNGYLMVHVFVIESDKGAERIVELIEKVASGVSGLGEAGSLSAGPTLGAIGAAAHVVLEGVKGFVKDDALLEHTHSGFDYNAYGTTSGSVFVGRNKKVCMELRVVATVRGAEGADSSTVTTTRPDNSCDADPPGPAPQRKKDGEHCGDARESSHECRSARTGS